MKTQNLNYNQYNNTNFTGRLTKFSSKLDKVLVNKKKEIPVNDLIELTDILISNEKKYTKKYRFLGKGYKGSVYQIDSKYALKVPEFSIRGINLPFFNDSFTEKLKCYYGDVIATFGKYQILKNIGKHIPIGIPLSMSNDKSKLHLECEKYYEEKFLPIFAKIPQKSFDAIAKDCKILNEIKGSETNQGYVFDFANPNNFVLKKDKIIITDGITPSISHNNKISDLLRALLNYKEFGSKNFPAKKNLPYFREIYKKIVIAGIKEGLPFGCDKDLQNWKLATEYLCDSKNKTEIVISTLSGLKWKYGDNIKELEKEVKKYLDSIFET